MAFSYAQQGPDITTATVYQDPSISLNSNILAVCVTSTTAAIRVFRIESNGTLTELVINSLPATQLGCVAVSPTGNYIYAGASATGQPFSRLWKYNSSTDEFDLIFTSGSSATYRTQNACWAPDESYVAVAGYSSSNTGILAVLGFDNTTDTLYVTSGGDKFVSLTGTTYRGWAVRVSPDSNFVGFCMTNGSAGATQRSYIYLVNRTTNTWSFTATYTVPAANSGAYMSWNADGSYLLIGRWVSGVPNLQLVKRTGSGLSSTFAIQGGLFTTNASRNPHYLFDNIFMGVGDNGINYWLQTGDTVATTTTPAGLEIISAIANVGISDPISNTRYIAAHVTTKLRVYKATGVIGNGTLNFSPFSAASEVKSEYGVFGTPIYPIFGSSGLINVPLVANGEVSFAVFTANGSGGVFEAQYTTAYQAPYSMIASISSAEYEIADPIETYGYGNLEYPILEASGFVNPLSEASGELIYPIYGVLGFLNIIEIDGTILYPDGFTVNGEFYNLKEFYGELTYPVFDIDANVTLSTSGSGELIYSSYSINAILSTTVVRGALTYPLVAVDGLIDVLYTEGSGEFNYPEYSASASVSLIDKISTEIIYPTFEIAAEGDVPTWSDGNFVYSGYIINGDVNVPIGSNTEAVYPVFSTSGVIGIKVNINGDEAYPVFKVIGSVGFVLSGDGNLKYPLYQIAGYSGANPEIEGTVNYPIYGTNFNVENYYGVASDSVLKVESDDTVASIGPRKNLIITEH